MSRNFFATGFLALVLGAISSSRFPAACSTVAQNQQQTPSAAAIDVTQTIGQDSTQHGVMNYSISMELGPADAEFDRRFLDAMTPHHQGAVAMAKQAQQKSKRPEIQKLAAEIIKDQDKEINQMKQWRQAWYLKASTEPIAYNAQMGHSMPMSQEQIKGMMMNMDLGAADSQFDLRFLNAMIPHHEGAVVMAQDALEKSKRPQIKKLAQEIIASQQAEIKQMKQWKQAWYKQ